MILSRLQRKRLTLHVPELVEYSEQLKACSERKADFRIHRRHMITILKLAHLTETAMKLLRLLKEILTVHLHDPGPIECLALLNGCSEGGIEIGTSGRRCRMKDRPTEKPVLLLGRKGKK